MLVLPEKRSLSLVKICYVMYIMATKGSMIIFAQKKTLQALNKVINMPYFYILGGLTLAGGNAGILVEPTI